MPGHPVLKKLKQVIAEAGGDGFILDQIADGKPLRKIAETIHIPGHGACSRGLLYTWRNDGGDDRRKGWKLAMHLSSHAHAEDAGDILDELSGGMPTAPEVQLARARSNYRTWLAGKRNEDYGDKQQQLQLNVNVGELHLDALRKRGHMDAVRPADRSTQVEAADYKILEAGDESV